MALAQTFGVSARAIRLGDRRNLCETKPRRAPVAINNGSSAVSALSKFIQELPKAELHLHVADRFACRGVLRSPGAHAQGHPIR